MSQEQHSVSNEGSSISPSTPPLTRPPVPVISAAQDSDAEQETPMVHSSTPRIRIWPQTKTFSKGIRDNPSHSPHSASVAFPLPSPLLSSAFPPPTSTANGVSSSSAIPKTLPRRLSAPTQSESKGRTKGHVFTINQETYIAELLADPGTWSLLDGPSDRNSYHESKTEVREGIAKKVNLKFSTEEKPVTLDSFQIKNKIDNMKMAWKKTYLVLKTTGNENLPNKTLKEKVIQICHFYYILVEVWSASWSLNTRKPYQLTDNITRFAPDDNDITSDDGDGWDAEARPLDSPDGLPETSATSEYRSSTTLAKTSNKRKNEESDYVAILKNLTYISECAHELKRQKLAIKERAVENNRWYQEAQIRFIEMQTLKLKAEMETDKMKLEIEKIKALAEMKRAEAELVKAQSTGIFTKSEK
ncbi:hypothetical protein BGZ58_008744 [Dissophora ornata]|nr:hypothetical protein BGZ58_008744 [Dissophora ornata]